MVELTISVHISKYAMCSSSKCFFFVSTELMYDDGMHEQSIVICFTAVPSTSIIPVSDQRQPSHSTSITDFTEKDVEPDDIANVNCEPVADAVG